MKAKKTKKYVWYVGFVIHVTTPFQYIPKLFITDVPEDEEITWDLIDKYKFFGEFGIPHANHYIDILTQNSPPDVIRAWRSGEVETISYDDL